MFDDHQEQTKNWPHNRFADIRNIFELFNKNCLKHVIPLEYLAIDETLYAMRNRISIKQYNPNKPAKYGLLFISLNDARFPHRYNSLVYAGKPEQGDGPFYIEGIETCKNIGRKNRFKTTSARRKYINGPPLHKHTYCKLVVGKKQ